MTTKSTNSNPSNTTNVLLVHGINTNGHNTWRYVERVFSAVGLNCRTLRYREFHGPLAFIKVVLWPWAIPVILFPLLLLTHSPIIVGFTAWTLSLTTFAILGYEQFDWYRSPTDHRWAYFAAWKWHTGAIVLGAFLVLIARLVSDSLDSLNHAWPNSLFAFSWFAFVLTIAIEERFICGWWDGAIQRRAQPQIPRPVLCVLFLTSTTTPAIVLATSSGWLALDATWWCLFCLHGILILIASWFEAAFKRSAAIDRFVRRYPEPHTLACVNSKHVPTHAVVAHSLGTFVTVGGLLRLPFCPRADRVILVGSPLRRMYNWGPLFQTNRRVGEHINTKEKIGRLRNEVGGEDLIIKCASYCPLPRQFGGAGNKGFLDGGFHQICEACPGCKTCQDVCRAVAHNVVRPNGEHSTAFLSSAYAVREWLPFLLGYKVESYNALLLACGELINCVGDVNPYDCEELSNRYKHDHVFSHLINTVWTSPWVFSYPYNQFNHQQIATVESQVEFSLSRSSEPEKQELISLIKPAACIVFAALLAEAYGNLAEDNREANPMLAANIVPWYAIESAVMAVFARMGLNTAL